MRQRKTGRSAQDAYVLFLLAVFAVLSIALLLFGVLACRRTTELAEMHDNERIYRSLVRRAAREGDKQGAMRVVHENGIPALCVEFGTDEDGGRWRTYIYAYDGQLRTLSIESGETFVPKRGELVCPAAAFEAQIDEQRLTGVLTTKNGAKWETSVALRCKGVTP